jgi:hypothetical protein
MTVGSVPSRAGWYGRSPLATLLERGVCERGICRLQTISSLLQQLLELSYRPLLSLRAYAHTGSVIGIDERMRSDLIVYLEQPQLGRRQPRKCVVYVAGENLPRRSIVQFDDVAFGMLHDSHALTCRNPTNEKGGARREFPALKCRSTLNAAVQPALVFIFDSLEKVLDRIVARFVPGRFGLAQVGSSDPPEQLSRDLPG